MYVFCYFLTVGAEEPSVLLKPSVLQLDFNDHGNITCTTYGSNVEIEWLRNAYVKGTRKLQKVPTEKIYALADITNAGNYRKQQTIIFKNVTVNDAGSYICKATLDRKPVFKEVDVLVKGNELKHKTPFTLFAPSFCALRTLFSTLRTLFLHPSHPLFFLLTLEPIPMLFVFSSCHLQCFVTLSNEFLTALVFNQYKSDTYYV